MTRVRAAKNPERKRARQERALARLLAAEPRVERGRMVNNPETVAKQVEALRAAMARG